MIRSTPPSSSTRTTRTEAPPPPRPTTLSTLSTTTPAAPSTPAPAGSRAGSAGQTTQTATALRADVEGRVATTSPTPSSPVLALPDLARGATGEPVRVLQDHLVKAGLMTQAEVDTGPGVFGPRTARALSQLQASQGLPVTGRLDGGTRRALAAVTSGAPATSTPPAPGAPVTSAAQATAFHVTQWGEPGQDAFNSGGTRFGFNDCGPASGVVALTALGLMPHPGPQGAMGAIDRVRDAALGRDTVQSERMGFDTLKRGVEAQGAVTSYVVPSAAGGRDLSGIDAALARGNPVIVGGDPKTAWSQDLARRGDYLDNDGQVGGHFVTVSGRADNGNYIVNDPLNARGAMEVTPTQLSSFLQSSFGPTAMEVARPDGRGIGAPSSPAAPPSSSTPTTRTTPTTPTPPTTPMTTLTRGMQSPAVQEAQQALVRAGLMTQAEMHTGPGIFGPRTERAVRTLQGQAGLPVTGRIDDATRTALAQAAARGPQAPAAPVTTPPPTMRPGDAALAPQVIGAARGDGSVNGALAWSADQMPGGTGQGVNSNNGQSVAATPNAWNSWCLAFVSTSYGRQVPELQAPDAITSSRKFEAAGKLHASTTNIPAGAPVFFAATPSNGQFGHIALATGRTDPATGEPLIRSSGWNGKPGIFEAPLSYFTRTTGAWLGWGDVGAR